MSLSRRGLIATTGATILATPSLRAQPAFPSRPIRVIAAFAAGGTSDAMARLIQPQMSEFLGVPVLVENRAGAAGALAATAVFNAPADGHTLLLDAASFVIAGFVQRNLPFDYETAFLPVGSVADLPYILAVGTRTGIRDFAGYLDTARLAQHGMVYGTPGVGNTGHLAGVLLAHRSGLTMEHVPYRGGAEVARDLAVGTLPSGYLPAGSLHSVLDAGRARPIALTSGERRGGIDGVPTIAECGFPGFDLTSWNAIFCRAGTPEDVRLQLEAALNHATAEPEVQARLRTMGAVRVPTESGRLAVRVARERALLRDLIRDTGLSLG